MMPQKVSEWVNQGTEVFAKIAIRNKKSFRGELACAV